MFNCKTPCGYRNLSGGMIRRHRKKLGLSQHHLAVRLQCLGMNTPKNSIQRMEARYGYVTDIELFYLSQALECPLIELLDFSEME